MGEFYQDQTSDILLTGATLAVSEMRCVAGVKQHTCKTETVATTSRG